MLLLGQIDGQEITASAVLTQRVRPPPRRLSPPRRMPPPPPMWRRSPPRMRRRYFEFLTLQLCIVCVFILFPFAPQEPFFSKKMFVSSQIPLPKEAVPGTPPLSLQISWSQASPISFQLQLLQIDEFLVYCVLLDSPSDQLEFLIPRPPRLNTNQTICIVANTNRCLQVESGSLLFCLFFVQM